MKGWLKKEGEEKGKSQDLWKSIIPRRTYQGPSGACRRDLKKGRQFLLMPFSSNSIPEENQEQVNKSINEIVGT